MNLRYGIWYGFFSFLAFGFSIVLIGPVIPIIEKTYSVSHSYIGLALSLGSILFLLSSLLLGYLIERINAFILMRIAMFIFSLSILVFIVMNSFELFVIGYMLLNIGGAGIEIYIPFLIGVMPGGKKAKNLNLVHSAFALGAIVSPLITSLALKYPNYWKTPFFIAFILTLLLHIFLFKMKKSISNIHGEYLKEKGTIKGLFSMFFILLILSLSFYVAYEMNFSAWISTFLHEAKNINVSKAALFPSFLWLGLFFGRILFSALPEKIGYKMWLSVSILIAGISLFLIMIMKNIIVSALLTILLGFSYATIYPTIQAIIVETHKNNKGIALSVASASMSLISGGASYLIGYVAQIYSIFAGFVIILFFILIDLITVLFYRDG